MCKTCGNKFHKPMEKVLNYIGEKQDLETELTRMTKERNILMYITIGLSVATVGLLVFAFRKKR